MRARVADKQLRSDISLTCLGAQTWEVACARCQATVHQALHWGSCQQHRQARTLDLASPQTLLDVETAVNRLEKERVFCQRIVKLVSSHCKLLDVNWGEPLSAKQHVRLMQLV